LWSFDFAEIGERQHAGDWRGAGVLLVEAARKLEAGGADGLVVCTNTMHRLADEVQAAVSIPLIHIADATAVAVRDAGVRRPALLATRFTMEQDFYKGRLAEKYGLQPVVPGQAGRDMVHRVIYDELCQGIVKSESHVAYVEEVGRLRRDENIDGVIMGCTEITMLIGQADFDIPVFDTTRLHAEAAVAFALS
ncbi:MAG: aspartate/glutamate racemase family protein, partial [Mesorhizobium sp.]